MNNYFFNLDNINPYTLEDLDGKTLKIKVSKSVDGTIIAGIDIETKNIYVLDVKIEME